MLQFPLCLIPAQSMQHEHPHHLLYSMRWWLVTCAVALAILCMCPNESSALPENVTNSSIKGYSLDTWVFVQKSRQIRSIPIDPIESNCQANNLGIWQISWDCSSNPWELYSWYQWFLGFTIFHVVSWTCIFQAQTGLCKICPPHMKEQNKMAGKHPSGFNPDNHICQAHIDIIVVVLQSALSK